MDLLIAILVISLLGGPVLTRLLRKMGILASEENEQRHVQLRGESEILMRRIKRIDETLREQDPYGVTASIAETGWLSLGPKGALISDAVSFILKAEDVGSRTALREAGDMREELKERLKISDECIADHAAFIREQRAACIAEVTRLFAEHAAKEEHSLERPSLVEHRG